MTKQERKDALKSQLINALTTPAIGSEQTNRGKVLLDFATPTLIRVSINELEPYENNPRLTENSKYDDLKESIRTSGVHHAFNITKLPHEDHYRILDGGNTRLKALKELYKETLDERFLYIDCIFKPYQDRNDADVILDHLSENDVRGNLVYIEKALAFQKIKNLTDESLSLRQLAKLLGDKGHPISYQKLGVMFQTLKILYPYIPQKLLAGMGTPQIKKLLKLYSDCENLLKMCQRYDGTMPDDVVSVEEFPSVWGQVLATFDNNRINLNEKKFVQELKIALRISTAEEEDDNQVITKAEHKEHEDDNARAMRALVAEKFGIKDTHHDDEIGASTESDESEQSIEGEPDSNVIFTQICQTLLALGNKCGFSEQIMIDYNDKLVLIDDVQSFESCSENPAMAHSVYRMVRAIINLEGEPLSLLPLIQTENDDFIKEGVFEHLITLIILLREFGNMKRQ